MPYTNQGEVWKKPEEGAAREAAEIPVRRLGEQADEVGISEDLLCSRRPTVMEGLSLLNSIASGWHVAVVGVDSLSRSSDHF